MDACPVELKPFERAFEERRRQQDRDMYNMGAYVYHAVLAAVDNALRGRKSKAQYLDKPLLELQEERNAAEGKFKSFDDRVKQETKVMNTLLKMQQHFEASKKRREGG